MNISLNIERNDRSFFKATFTISVFLSVRCFYFSALVKLKFLVIYFGGFYHIFLSFILSKISYLIITKMYLNSYPGSTSLVFKSHRLLP